ncbi:MAG: phosphoribosylanthranilate isomerase [Chthoniobacteraceae bacterium]
MSTAPRRVRVKICGVTNRDDAETAVALGADGLGFNLYAGSKRCIDLDREGEWIAALPPLVMRVAVLVNATLDEARRVAAHPAIHCVQFHGDEDADYCAVFARSGRPFIKALRLCDSGVSAQASHFATTHLLLDADAGAAFGGTGTPIDLGLAAEVVRARPEMHVFLAGGLRAETVGTAIAAVRPYAVDVASGVELADDPRRKDPKRMAAFIDAVREAGEAPRLPFSSWQL